MPFGFRSPNAQKEWVCCYDHSDTINRGHKFQLQRVSTPNKRKFRIPGFDFAPIASLASHTRRVASLLHRDHSLTPPPVCTEDTQGWKLEAVPPYATSIWEKLFLIRYGLQERRASSKRVHHGRDREYRKRALSTRKMSTSTPPYPQDNIISTHSSHPHRAERRSGEANSGDVSPVA